MIKICQSFWNGLQDNNYKLVNDFCWANEDKNSLNTQHVSYVARLSAAMPHSEPRKKHMAW